MLKLKKSLVILLLTAVVMSAFAGCGKKEESAKNSASTQQTSTADNAPKPELKALLSYKSGIDYNNYPVTKYLEEATGYKVKYDMLPQDNPMDKLNIIIASGEEYDFVTIYDKTRYADFAKKGALVDLEPLVKKLGSNIVKNIDAESFDSIRVDGKYYAIPSMQASGNQDATNVGGGLLVRQDWMEKLGIKAPTTIDEFTNMLQQFKDKDPNGNGAKNIPLTTTNTLGLMDVGLGGAFGIPTSWVDVNGSLVNRILLPGYKDYIMYLRELYSKGLLDKEAPTNQESTKKEKFTSGRAGVCTEGWASIPSIADTMKTTQPSAKTMYLPPLSGKGGKAAIPASYLKVAVDCYSFIPKTSKNVEQVIKYFNLKLDEDIFRAMVIGKENEHYTVKEGAYYPILPKFNDDRGNANNYLTGVTKNYGQYWQARVRKDERLYKGWKELNSDYAQYFVIDPVSKAPTLTSRSKYDAALIKMNDDFLVKSVVADFSDATLNAFIAQWKAEGGDEITKEVNDWYKTTKK